MHLFLFFLLALSFLVDIEEVHQVVAKGKVAGKWLKNVKHEELGKKEERIRGGTIIISHLTLLLGMVQNHIH